MCWAFRGRLIPSDGWKNRADSVLHPPTERLMRNPVPYQVLVHHCLPRVRHEPEFWSLRLNARKSRHLKDLHLIRYKIMTNPSATGHRRPTSRCSETRSVVDSSGFFATEYFA